MYTSYSTAPPMVQKTTLVFEREGVSFKADLPWDADVDMVMNAFTALMIGMGYMKGSIDDWIVQSAELITETDDRTEDTI